MPARHASKKKSDKDDVNFNHLLYFISFCLLAITISFLNLVMSATKQAKVVNMDNIDQERAYWRKVINEYPSFRDGYLVLAKLEREKGNVLAAESLEREAVKIDPLHFLENQ